VEVTAFFIVINLLIVAAFGAVIFSTQQPPSTWQEWVITVAFVIGPAINIFLFVSYKSSTKGDFFGLNRILLRFLAFVPLALSYFLDRFEWLALTSFVLGVIGPWELWNFFDRHGFEGFGIRIPPRIQAGDIQPPKTERPRHSAMELKILNTLWTKQVTKFPEFDRFFTFVIGSKSPEYFEFRKAGSKLIGEGYAGETQEGHYHITKDGFEYCKKHYKEFPSDQWWPQEPMSQENLKKVMGNSEDTILN
jgi:hypothetical protein